ncbi:ribosomal RNA processing protein 36 homolog [Osmia lignaria lignaria]|uniref:ribosomal RNA processing protein 36 homolog n=1 Tax=Osmia lignaria lignaria TaxID=1437193 RepID=UPI0014797E12|nr:ribosomal RNA processing protein 36 homolog [Osmia lignaria]
MKDDDDALLNKDKNQDQIRAELSQMSFEDLQKLKEKLGTKIYKEALFGPGKVRKIEFKRENKNRPREMSAKKPVSRFREAVHVKKSIPRDPRFDSLCGTFDQKVFKKTYGFLGEMKKNDLAALKKQLKETEDPKIIKKVKYLIQRLENQLREEKRKEQDEEQKSKEKKEIVEAIKRGEKPAFKKKSEKKVLNLVSQYEELKNSGKLKKHIQRLRKKNMRKDRQRLASNSEIE